jgi:hypothetical protein
LALLIAINRASQDKEGKDIRSSHTTLPISNDPRRQKNIIVGNNADRHLDMSCHSTQKTKLPPKPTAKGSDTTRAYNNGYVYKLTKINKNIKLQYVCYYPD